jgi:hypothetical protein
MLVMVLRWERSRLLGNHLSATPRASIYAGVRRYAAGIVFLVKCCVFAFGEILTILVESHNVFCFTFGFIHLNESGREKNSGIDSLEPPKLTFGC